jgi:hypothetical protein
VLLTSPSSRRRIVRRASIFALCAVAATCTVVATAAATPPAPAVLSFLRLADGSAEVGARPSGFGSTSFRLDIVRNGAVIATDGRSGQYAWADIRLANLWTGDVANVYENGGLQGSVSYDGLPSIGTDACAGHSSFTGTRSAGATVYQASSFAKQDPYQETRSIWTSGNPFTVSLQTPLAAGDIAIVATQQTFPALNVSSTLETTVGACPVPPASVPITQASPPPVRDGTVQGPSEQQIHAFNTALTKLRTRVRSLDPAAVARRHTLKLAYTFGEPGTVRVDLTVPGKKKSSKPVVIGSGSASASSAGAHTVTLKLTAAGRKLLARAQKLALTVQAAFTPRGNGIELDGGRTVTLKRKPKHKH